MIRPKKTRTKIPSSKRDIKYRPAHSIPSSSDPLSGGYSFYRNGISYNAYPTFPCESYPFEIPQHRRHSSRKLRHSNRILHRKKKKASRYPPESLCTPPSSPPKLDTKLANSQDTQLQLEFTDAKWDTIYYDFNSWITNRLKDLRQQKG